MLLLIWGGICFLRSERHVYLAQSKRLDERQVGDGELMGLGQVLSGAPGRPPPSNLRKAVPVPPSPSVPQSWDDTQLSTVNRHPDFSSCLKTELHRRLVWQQTTCEELMDRRSSFSSVMSSSCEMARQAWTVPPVEGGWGLGPHCPTRLCLG